MPEFLAENTACPVCRLTAMTSVAVNVTLKFLLLNVLAGVAEVVAAEASTRSAANVIAFVISLAF